MHYDPNYRNQFFRDSANSFGIREAFAVMKREFQVAEYKTKMPKSKPTRVTNLALLGVVLLVLAATAIIWFVSRSLMLIVTLFCIMAFASVGIVALIVMIAGSVLKRACTEAVEATCIGYSFATGSSHDSRGGRLERTPVFEYEYQGMKCVAFDGVYDNFSEIPVVSQKTTILVNPSDPEDIVWNFGKRRSIFLILAFAFATVLSISMLLVILNDDNFMKAALSDGEPKTEAQSTQNSGSEISSEESFVIRQTDDGRIIMDDAYLRNEVFFHYPDSEYVVKKRKVSEVEVLDDGEMYIVHFKDDPDFSESEWYFTKEDALVDEVKSTKAGDEFIFAEVKEVGACWIFSTKEYELE